MRNTPPLCKKSHREALIGRWICYSPARYRGQKPMEILWSPMPDLRACIIGSFTSNINFTNWMNIRSEVEENKHNKNQNHVNETRWWLNISCPNVEVHMDRWSKWSIPHLQFYWIDLQGGASGHHSAHGLTGKICGQTRLILTQIKVTNLEWARGSRRVHVNCLFLVSKVHFCKPRFHY